MSLAVCAAAYGFLGAYAAFDLQSERLAAQQGRKQKMDFRRQELQRKKSVMAQAQAFSTRLADLGLERRKWRFYEVNVQAGVSYEAAQRLIEQCRDSELAYYWPIALEIEVPQKVGPKAGQSKPGEVKGDVQLTIKGQFVARQP